MTAARSRARAPLPSGMPPAEREFFEQLRRECDLAGLSHRELEHLTEAAGAAAFCSRSTWARALRGEARPPLQAVRARCGRAGGPGGGGTLPELWERAFAEGPPPLPRDDPLAQPRQLPAAVHAFTGRVAELTELDRVADQAASGHSVAIAAISGTAGVGKTALALHWAHRAAAAFPDGQLYVNLRGYDPSGCPVDPREALQGFAEALGVPPGRLPAGTQARAGLYRTLMASRRMLVVLDNARDAGQVRPLLPGGGGSLVLVTSRSELAGLAAADGAHAVAVDVPGDDDARHPEGFPHGRAGERAEQRVL